jgi:hypothetical protein
MALILFNGDGSSISSRFNLLLLITFVLVCFCSSSPFIHDIDSSTYDIDDDYIPSPGFINIPEPRIFPSKDSLRNLLLKSIAIEPTYRHKDYNNKRYASQAFHAMRG